MNTPEPVVIEIGCGTGQNLSQFGNLAHKERKAPRLVGIDYSSSHRDLASNVYGIDEVYASTDELPPNLLGDVLILSHVLEHFPDLDHSLLRIANMIKDGGILYVEVPGVLNLADNLAYKLNFKQYSHLPHTYCYTLKTLAYVLSHFGFKLIDGDEFIRAVFRRDSRTTPLSPPENAPRAVLETMELLKLPHYDLTSRALKADEDGDYELGKILAGKALDMTPEFPYAQVALATIHAHARNHEDAVHYARRALESGLADPSPVMLLLGRELEILGRLCEAEEIYREHLELYPWDLRAKTGLARIANLQGDHAEALRRTRSIGERWLYEPHAVLEEGRALKLSGKLEESLGIMAELHRIYPYAPEPLFELAEIAQKQGRFADAASYFEQGLEIQPKSSWGWYCLAESRRNLGDTDAALDAVHRSLDLLPTMIQARILRAGLLAQVARYDDALAAFRAIHDDHPGRADLLLNMADIHRYKGDYAKALMVVDEYASRYGESEQLAIALAKIKDVMEASSSHSA